MKLLTKLKFPRFRLWTWWAIYTTTYRYRRARLGYPQSRWRAMKDSWRVVFNAPPIPTKKGPV